MERMKLLITGGAGCLGSNLIEHYLPLGHEILVIDNYATGKREALPTLPNLTVVEGSIADDNLVKECFKKFVPTHIIHSAAAYKDPADWAEDSSTNVLGAINIAKASQGAGIKRLINLQTSLCFGHPTQIPIPISHPTAPFTSYGISKTAGEAYLIQSGLPVVSLRLANICGPRLAIGPIPTFYQRLKANKNCFCSDTVRDFLDMSDFISIIDLILSDEGVMGVLNVSTGEGHSIKDVFNKVVSYLQFEVPDVPVLPPGKDDVAVVVLDPSETEKITGWRAKISFEDTIYNQLQWYDAYGVTDIYSHLASSDNLRRNDG